MAVIEIDNLSFHYKQLPVLSDVTVAVEQGSFWSILGPNGAGKSTLIRLLAGLLAPQKGLIRLNNRRLSTYKIRDLSRQIAMVCQEYVPAFGFTVLETVSMARAGREGFVLFEDENDKTAIQGAMEQTQISHLAHRKLNELSGGERQRVFIARALAQDTPILLLDEPTNHLDIKHQVYIFDLLKLLQKDRNKTIFAVTHNINLTCQYCDQVLLLGGAGRYEVGNPSQVIDIDRLKSYFDVEGHHGFIGNTPFFVPLGRYSVEFKSHQSQ
ncbi:MAG: ABC transporter ATP-binding protein [Sedimentisphaerales bacterium]|nr:ABC transporter ATP-binding protein [Sedimentisphaerales bacterium]